MEQPELNDLARDLKLPKCLSELLASRLQEKRILGKTAKVSSFRTRNKILSSFFAVRESVCVCIDIENLMRELGFEHNKSEWRLFIDGSNASLKAVLLHNGNERPSIPIAHVTGMKESYESMKLILRLINYEKYNWKLCCDLKVVAFLTGLQKGWTKHCCFLCLWDSRAKTKHFKVKTWPKRNNLIAGTLNVVNPKNVLLPSLHIKLGLIKNFVKAMDKNGAGFQYLKEVFPKMSDKKLLAGVFVGPQIRKLIRNPEFDRMLNRKELNAWKSFKKVVSEFLGNKRSKSSKKIVVDMLKKY